MFRSEAKKLVSISDENCIKNLAMISSDMYYYYILLLVNFRSEKLKHTNKLNMYFSVCGYLGYSIFRVGFFSDGIGILYEFLKSSDRIPLGKATRNFRAIMWKSRNFSQLWLTKKEHIFKFAKIPEYRYPLYSGKYLIVNHSTNWTCNKTLWHFISKWWGNPRIIQILFSLP